MAEAGGLSAAAASSSAWISPAHSEAKEIVGISPVMSSSLGYAQPVQAEPGGCAETSTKSCELAPAQTQPAAARWAAHRDGMWSTPTSSRGAIGARRYAVVSSKVSSDPVMVMRGV